MQEIIAQRLWIGHAGDARDVTGALNRGVEAVLQLAMEEPALSYPRDVTYCRVPLNDSGENSPDLLRIAVDFAASCLAQEIPLFICCSAGMSRSPAVAAAALARVRQMSLEDALEAIAANRPHDVLPGLWAQIEETCAPGAAGR